MQNQFENNWGFKVQFGSNKQTKNSSFAPVVKISAL